MRFSEALIASSVVIPFASAHGGRGMPKIWGMGPDVKREAFGPVAPRHASSGSLMANSFSKRQDTTNTNTGGPCGPTAGGASCAEGYCCSPSGWCGNTPEYCNSPDCLLDYGPNCDANKVPNGDDTRNIARPQLGSIPYGNGGLYHCTEPGTVAITYDDGPYIYTDYILDLFTKYDMKATFFITGINNGKGAIDDASTIYPDVITKMYNAGHQVASHTWSHQDLSLITKAQRMNQMVYNEMALRNIIQKFPTYMRPPYSSCTQDSGCYQDMVDLGYVVTYFDIDTDDYDNDSPLLIQNAKNNFDAYFKTDNVATDSFMSIEHDIHEQTAYNLTEYMLQIIQNKGYRGVTVGECLGDPVENWYRDSAGKTVTSSHATTATATATSSAIPTATPTKVSTDGTCGSNTGSTCQGSTFGNCCSQAGWCGTSTDHCGTGCQSVFGTCGSSSSSAVSSAASSTVSSTVSSAASSVVSSVASSVSSAPSSTATALSTDGQCGPSNGKGCQGTSYGNCCSPAGWCGSSDAHCGTGCNPLFGTCGSSTASSVLAAASSVAPVSSTASAVVSTSVAPVSSQAASVASSVVATASSVAPVSSKAASSASAPAASASGVTGNPTTDGTCGGSTGSNCIGWSDGECCSAYGWCGSTADYCGATCNPLYGNCTSSSSAVTTIAASVVASSTSAAAPAKTSAVLKVSTNGKCGTRNGKACPGSECCSVNGYCGTGKNYCRSGCQTGFGVCK